MLFLLLLSAADPSETLSLSETLNKVGQTFQDVRGGLFRDIFLNDSMTNGGKGIGALKDSYMTGVVEAVFQSSSDTLENTIKNLTAKISDLTASYKAFIERRQYDVRDQMERAQERAENFNRALQNELNAACTIVGIQQSLSSAKTVDGIAATIATLQHLNGATDLVKAKITETLIAACAKSAELNQAQQASAEAKVQKITSERAKSRAQHLTNADRLKAANAQVGEEKERLLKEVADAEAAVARQEEELDRQGREAHEQQVAAAQRLKEAQLLRKQIELKAAQRKLIAEATDLFAKGQETHRKIVEYVTEIDNFNRAFELDQMDLESKIKATVRMLVILNHMGDKVIKKMEADFKAEQQKAQKKDKEKKGKGLLNLLFSEAEIKAAKVTNGLLTHLTKDTDKEAAFFTKQPEAPKPAQNAEEKLSKEERKANQAKAKADQVSAKEAWENERFAILLPQVSKYVHGALDQFSERMLSKSRKVLSDVSKSAKYNKEAIASLRVASAEIEKIQKEVEDLRS